MPDRPRRAGFATGLALATLTPLVLAPLAAPATGSGTGEFLGIFVVVAYAGHVATTGWLWTVPDVRAMVRSRPARLVVLPAAAMVGSAAVALGVPHHLFEVLLLVFFAWQFFHFERQNLGLVSLVARKWAAPPLTRPERELIAVACCCGIGALLGRPQLLGVSTIVVPASLSTAVVHTAEVGLVTCAVATAVAVRPARRPIPVTLAQITAVTFMAPVFIFHTAGAAVTGMVIAHGMQYLWVVGWRSLSARRRRPVSVLRTVLGIGSLAIVGGAGLEAMSELHASGAAALRLLYGAYLGAVMAHFALDAVIWRPPTGSAPPFVQVRPLLPSPAHGRF